MGCVWYNVRMALTAAGAGNDNRIAGSLHDSIEKLWSADRAKAAYI